MHRITLEVNNLLYDHIMSFLRSLPGNAISIQLDTPQIKRKNCNEPPHSLSHLKKIQGVGKELYEGVNADQYLRELRNEW